MVKKPTDIVPLQVRMRESLRRKIEKASSGNAVSMNQEIVDRLESTFDTEAQSIGVQSVLGIAMGDKRNAALLSMFASVLAVADMSRAETGADGIDWSESVATAITTILSAVEEELRPLSQDELDAMLPRRRHGVILADVILQRRGYPAVIARSSDDKRSPLQRLMGFSKESAG